MSKVFLYQLLFLSTGIVSTLGAQWLKYRGAATSWSFVVSLCQFLGMSSVVFLPPPPRMSLSSQQNTPKRDSGPFGALIARLQKYGHVDLGWAAGISVLEVVGQLVLVAGMYLVGSGIYMVIYSSIVVFTALFSWLLLPNRELSVLQWLSVLAICIGLSLTAIGQKDHIEGSQKVPERPLMFGIIVCLMGTSINSLVYVSTDHVLSTEKATAYSQSLYVGLFSSLFTIAVMIVISIPTLVSLPLFDWDVILGHMLLILASLGHSVAYFELVESTGGVATGVLQGLRAVFVFALSHAWFCGLDEHQCYTAWKGVATVVVVCGVISFGAAKALKGIDEQGHLFVPLEDDEVLLEEMIH